MKQFLLLLLISAHPLHAELVLDLSRDRDLQRVLREVPIFSSSSNQSGRRKIFSAQRDSSKEKNFELAIRLPEAGVIRVKSWFVLLEASSNEVFRILTHSGIMPIEEAYQAATGIGVAMKLQTSRVDDWYREASLNKGPRSCTLMSRSYPEISIHIRSSINTIYPYMLSAEIGWPTDLGGLNLPPPFPEPLTVSLDPPSGNIYDPAEMWGSKEENGRQMEEWLRHHPDQADKVRQEIARRKQEAQNSPASAVVRLNSDKSAILPPAFRPFPWLLPVMILGGLVILGFTVRALRTKQR